VKHGGDGSARGNCDQQEPAECRRLHQICALRRGTAQRGILDGKRARNEQMADVVRGEAAGDR
jgi:hypothetical protein